MNLPIRCLRREDFAGDGNLLPARLGGGFKFVCLFSSLFLFGLVTPRASVAYVIGYEFEVYDEPNICRMNIANTSDIHSIEKFTITIGDTRYNYDLVFDGIQGESPLQSGGISYSFLSPDTLNGFVRSDELVLEFTDGFIPGGWFDFRTDLDIDSRDTIENYRTILYNTFNIPNARVTVSFSDGNILTQVLPDAPGENFITQSLSVPSPVAIPGAFLLLASGFIGLVVSRSKNK
jgi:hypothetical protein